MRKLRFLIGTGVIAAAVFGAAPVAAADHATVCNGTLAPGTYHSVVVPQHGVCLSDGPVTIRAGVFVQPGGTLVLGSAENPVPTATIGGGVRATHPMSVQIHFSTINGGIDIRGGSGPFGGPFGMTWNAIEDNVINGGYNEIGYNGFWNGFIRNTVSGSVNLIHNQVADPDGNEVVTNTIHGDLNCVGNDPAPQVGDSEGAPNRVTGAKTGQCAGL